MHNNLAAIAREMILAIMSYNNRDNSFRIETVMQIIETMPR